MFRDLLKLIKSDAEKRIFDVGMQGTLCLQTHTCYKLNITVDEAIDLFKNKFESRSFRIKAFGFS